MGGAWPPGPYVLRCATPATRRRICGFVQVAFRASPRTDVVHIGLHIDGVCVEYVCNMDGKLMGLIHCKFMQNGAEHVWKMDGSFMEKAWSLGVNSWNGNEGR